MNARHVPAPEHPEASCPSWCDGECLPDRGDGVRTHWRTLASGQVTGSHGTIYDVTLEQVDRIDSSLTQLFVQLETNTLTAEMAEVIGTALLQGARALREAGEGAETAVKLKAITDEDSWRQFDPTDPGPPVVDPRSVNAA